MAKKKKSTSKSPAVEKRNSTVNPVNKPPKWGLLVAGLGAFLLVNVALIVMDKLGVTNPLVKTGVVMVLAVFAGIMARPLTFALQRRFGSFK